MYIGLTNLGLNSSRSNNGTGIATEWASRVVSNGGTVSAATQAAVATFVTSCINSGVWPKLNRVNLFCGNQLASALVPLKVGAGTATDVATAFIGGDYTEATGLTGNASTKYLSTGVSDTVFGLDVHISAYLRTVPTQILGWPIGTNATCISRTANPSAAARLGQGGIEAASAVSVVPGYYIGTRQSSTSAKLFVSGVLAQDNSTLVVDGTGTSINVFNRGGALDRFDNVALNGYTIGTALSDVEVASLQSIMQTFQTSLSRQV